MKINHSLYLFSQLVVVVLILTMPSILLAQEKITNSPLKIKSPLGNDSLSMYIGEVRVLPIKGIDRVAVGNPKIMSNSILSQGQLVVLANEEGYTTLYIWLDDGSERRFDVRVKDKKQFDNSAEVNALVSKIPGVRARKIGQTTVVEGFVSLADKEVFDHIMARYQGVLNLVQPADSFEDVKKLLSHVEHLKFQKMGNETVIFGEVAEDDAKLVQLVTKRYPNLINMTKQKDIVADKMIYMQVKIMEISKKFSEDIGINWNVSGIKGPSVGYGVEGNRNGATILNSKDVSDVFTKSGLPDLTSAAGYFGIASEITSTINLAEISGDAITLAEPRLSARSGGKAEFLAGGEYPMPTTSTQGQVTVEFKPYGISLKIEPFVDDNNNILAHVETEVSAIDSSVQVGGVPGIKSRSTQTDISMLENQTLVIAGLLSEDGSKNNEDVAWLRDIPILGYLFRSENYKKNKSELVIFVTPTIHDVNSPANKEALEKADIMQKELTRIVENNEILD